MSVYIKGMEMPTSCCNCPLAKLSPTGETLICNYTLSTVPWDGKPFDCPLVPVPEHGDLIDRDALGTPGTIEEDTLWRGRIETEVYLASTIYNAVTIIPADPAKEGEDDYASGRLPYSNGKRSVTDCVRRIKAIRAEDVVPVVRCRDCIHLSGVTNGGTFFRCDRYDNWQDEANRVYMPLDGFCSYGDKGT